MNNQEELKRKEAALNSQMQQVKSMQNELSRMIRDVPSRQELAELDAHAGFQIAMQIFQVGVMVGIPVFFIILAYHIFFV